jgi:hypothetical protein
MPTRYLKPGVRDSEAIDSLSPLAETLFYRLIVTVDDFGRFDGRPAMVKAACFPIKDMTPAKCSALLDELRQAGLLKLYIVEGKSYMQLCKWDNVPRSKESKFPACVDECIQVHTDVNIARTVLPVTVTETETETKTETVNRNTRKGADDVFPAGLDIQAWERWIAYRAQIKKPLKPMSIEAAQRELVKYAHQQMQVVEQSIANGWHGIFALKAGSGNPTTGKPRQSSHSGFEHMDYRTGIDEY